MYKLCFIYLGSLFFIFVNGLTEQVQQDEDQISLTPETQLHQDLFTKIKGRSFPVSDKPLQVYFGLTLKAVVDIDASNEALVLSAYIRQVWKNKDLVWDPELYGGIKKINIQPDKVWVPDIFTYANIEEDKGYNGLLSTMQTRIILSHTGHLSWLAPVILRLGCKMDFKNFPFDTQRCPIQFSSFTYDSLKLQLIPELVDIKTYKESAEWVFISMENKSSNTIYPGSDNPFSDVTYTLIMKRKPLYLLINIVLPNFLLAFLTIMVFVIPASAGERAIFVITILLALSWYMTSAVSYMPSSSESIPLFSYFLGLTLLASLLLSICLFYSIIFYYANCNILDLPPWMRKHIIESLAVYLGIESKRKESEWRKKYEEVKLTETNNKWEEIHYKEVDSLFYEHETSFSSEEGATNNLTGMFGTKNINAINNQLSFFLEKLAINDDKAWLQSEWKTISVTYDQLFLYIFAGIYLAAVLTCGIRLTQIE